MELGVSGIPVWFGFTCLGSLLKQGAHGKIKKERRNPSPPPKQNRRS